MKVERASNPSYGWRSILASKEVIRKGLRKKIGNGHDTKVWDEPWHPSTPARPPLNVGNFRDEELRVHHLIDQQNQSWNMELLNELDIQRVTSLRLSRTGRHDSYCWDFTKSGLYTVKSGYTVAHELRPEASHTSVTEPSTTGLKKAIWKIKAPRKLKHFLWQATSGYLATATQLKERQCSRESICVRCGAESETINHTLFECPPALQCWALSTIPTPPGIFPSNSLYSNLDFLLFRAKKGGVNPEVLASFPWIAWYIWKARNEKIFKDKDISPLDSLQLAVKKAESWTLAQRITEETTRNTEEQQSSVNGSVQATHTARWKCQIDASWTNAHDRAGLGFVQID